MRPALPRPSPTAIPSSESALDFSRHSGIVGEFEHRRSCDPSFTRVGSLLPQISITKHCLRKLEAVHLVREQRNEGRQVLAFHARPFVLCGLPLRRLPSDKSLYTRRNGKFFLQVLGHPQFGLPYGQDRLIPIWVATIAVRQRSRVVRFGAASEILDFFRLFKDGKRYRRLMDGFQRVFGATIFLAPMTSLTASWCSTGLASIFLTTFIFGFTRQKPSQSLHLTTRIAPFSAKPFTMRSTNIGFPWSGRSWPRWPTHQAYLIFTCGWFGKLGR